MVWAVVLAVLAFGAAAGLALGARAGGDLAWRALLLFIGALGAALAIQALRFPRDRKVSPGPKRRSRSSIPGSFIRVRDAVTSASASRPDFERGLRPMLLEVARDVLASRGVDLDADPVQARALLGPEASELLLGPSVGPGWTRERGPRRERLERVMDHLEAVAR